MKAARRMLAAQKYTLHDIQTSTGTAVREYLFLER